MPDDRCPIRKALQRVCAAAGVLAALAWWGCAPMETREVDFLDVDVPAPAPERLAAWQAVHEAGRDWRGDPRRVAHEEIRMRLDVPWKGEAYDAAKYEFLDRHPDHPDWGSYVVRGWSDGANRTFRYRVKVARWRDVWYARQVSHYVIAHLPDERFESGGPPDVR